jgi:hypothetical protein
MRIARGNYCNGRSSLEKRKKFGEFELWGKQSQEINKSRNFPFYNHRNIVLVTHIT